MTNIFKGTQWEFNASARHIIKGWIEKFKTRPSEVLQDKIEGATGVCGDFLARDHGQEVGHEWGQTEVVESLSTNPY